MAAAEDESVLLGRILDAAGITDEAARQHYFHWFPIERHQGQFFAGLVLKHIPNDLDVAIRTERLSLIDIGCSCGHLVKGLQVRYPHSLIEGIDIERIRIEAARQYYPDCLFRVGDVAQLTNTHDCVITSNVLEHFSSPLEVLEKVFAPRAKRFIVTLVPYQERTLSAGHLFTFEQDTFPREIARFRLIHQQVIDCLPEGADCWPGSQILTVYSRDL